MQVMLRGSRIVLADVETQLLSVPGVDQAVALVQDDPTGAQRLVAYVTPASLDGAEVLQQLRRRLPAHLMPASVVALPQVTLLVNMQSPGRWWNERTVLFFLYRSYLQPAVPGM